MVASPTTLMELNVRQAIIAIISKPRWWIKWKNAAIRSKWLKEIQYGYLLQTFSETYTKWISIHTYSYEDEDDDETVQYYAEKDEDPARILAADPSPEKDARAAAWLASPFPESPKYWGYDSNEEESFTERVSRQGAYTEIKWTLNHAMLRQKLKQIPYSEWTHAPGTAAADAFSAAILSSDPALIKYAAKWVVALLDHDLQNDSIPELLPGYTFSDEQLAILCFHGKKIGEEIAAVEAYIITAINMILEREKVNMANEGAESDRIVITSGGIHGVYISDNLIDNILHNKFVQEIAVLENVPEDQKDWHPKSGKKVLDVIHPSLYCYVRGKTMRLTTPIDPQAYQTPAEHMNHIMFSPVPKKLFYDHNCWNEYQWIPSDIHVNEDGKARILSYINNLHPEHHGAMYDSIGEIFSRFVPLFERTLSCKKFAFPKPTFNTPHSYEYECKRPSVPKMVEIPEHPPITVSLKSKTLQVIVKVAEIILTPEKPHYKGGSWHIEGTEREKIVATGIYYFGCDNIKDSCLSFRSDVGQRIDYEQGDHLGVANMYGLFNNKPPVQVQGSITTTFEGRCLAFPNFLQHKVEPFTLDDPTKPGVRKILAFFLVDPSVKILSTAVIPPQQEDWYATLQEPMLKKLCLVDSVQQEIMDMARVGMTLHEAKKHRLGLMKERTADVEVDPERYFSLCEH